MANKTCKFCKHYKQDDGWGECNHFRMSHYDPELPEHDNNLIRVQSYEHGGSTVEMNPEFGCLLFCLREMGQYSLDSNIQDQAIEQDIREQKAWENLGRILGATMIALNRPMPVKEKDESSDHYAKRLRIYSAENAAIISGIVVNEDG